MRGKALVLVTAAVFALGGVACHSKSTAVGSSGGSSPDASASALTASHLSIAYDHTTERFGGKVSSPDAECQAGRTVRVYRETASGQALEGMATSDKQGNWKVEVMHAHGHYYALTPRQEIMDTPCGTAQSKTVDVM